MVERRVLGLPLRKAVPRRLVHRDHHGFAPGRSLRRGMGILAARAEAVSLEPRLRVDAIRNLKDDQAHFGVVQFEVRSNLNCRFIGLLRNDHQLATSSAGH